MEAKVDLSGIEDLPIWDQLCMAEGRKAFLGAWPCSKFLPLTPEVQSRYGLWKKCEYLEYQNFLKYIMVSWKYSEKAEKTGNVLIT